MNEEKTCNCGFNLFFYRPKEIDCNVCGKPNHYIMLEVSSAGQLMTVCIDCVNECC
jgi:hypothetical protein